MRIMLLLLLVMDYFDIKLFAFGVKKRVPNGTLFFCFMVVYSGWKNPKFDQNLTKIAVYKEKEICEVFILKHLQISSCGPPRNWTGDTWIFSPLLYHWARGPSLNCECKGISFFWIDKIFRHIFSKIHYFSPSSPSHTPYFLSPITQIFICSYFLVSNIKLRIFWLNWFFLLSFLFF